MTALSPMAMRAGTLQSDQQFAEADTCSHRRDCHFADAIAPSILKHLLKGEGVQQNDSLADG